MTCKSAKKALALLLVFMLSFSYLLVLPAGNDAIAAEGSSQLPSAGDGAFGGDYVTAAGDLIVDYNSGEEKKLVLTGPLVPLASEKVYTESELKEKFATDKEKGDLYKLTMMNTFPTQRLYAIRAVSLWDVFADAGIGTDVYRNEDNFLQTVSSDGYIVSIGKGLTVGGSYLLSNFTVGTLDLPRYTYSMPEFYLPSITLETVPDPNVIGEEIPWFIAFSDGYSIVSNPNNTFPADASNSNQALRPYFGQLNNIYPNLPLSGDGTFRIVFSDQNLSQGDARNIPAAKVFNLLGKMSDRANIMTGSTDGAAAAEKVKGHYQTALADAVYFEGTDAASLLRTEVWPPPANGDYYIFAGADGQQVIANYATIASGNYTLVYATGTAADQVAPIERTIDGEKFYFDLFRNGQPVMQNVNSLTRTTAPAVDKNALEVLTYKASQLSENHYTPESWQALTVAVAAASAVLANANALQPEIDAALTALATLQTSLIEVTVNDLTVTQNSGAAKKLVITGPLVPTASEKVYLEAELKAKFAVNPDGDLYGLSVLNSLPAKSLYTIRGVSIWDIFNDAGIGAAVYRGAGNYLQTAGTDNYTVTVTELDTDRYRYPAASYLNNSEAGKEAIPGYIAFAESSSATGYPADGANTANALRTWFGQKSLDDVNNGLSGKNTYRLVLSDRKLDAPDVHNNAAAYVFTLLDQAYDRANILTGPLSGKTDGLTLGEKITGCFESYVDDFRWFEGTSVASLLQAATNNRVEDTDWFSFTNAAGALVEASFAEIKTGNYTLVYATGVAADKTVAIQRAIGGVKYYFDLYRDGGKIVENITGISRAESLVPDKTTLASLIAIGEVLKATDYPAPLWSSFTVVLNEARTVLANPEASKAQVDEITIDLRAFLIDLDALETFQAETLTITPGSGERDLNFTWYSDNVENKAAVVQIAPQAAMSDGRFPRDSAIVTTNGVVGSASTGKSWHKAGVTGLNPATEYVYRVSNDGKIFSEIYHFTTGDAGSFRFVAVGDPQLDGAMQDVLSLHPPVTTAAAWADTVANFTANFPDLRFLLGVGDNVESGGSEDQWADFFAPSALRGLPIATTGGNHDSGATLNGHFNPPNVTGSGNYWFKYNNALFVVLDTSGRPDATTIDTYAARFDATLKAATEANPDAQWLFISHHKSTASPGSHRNDADVKAYATAIGALADKYQADFVLAGHDHVYSRSFSIYENQKVTGIDYMQETVVNPKGTIYFTLNTASGGKYYNYGATEWYTNIASQTFVPNYTIVDVSGNSVTFATFRTDNNSVIDNYTVVKEAIKKGDLNNDGEIDIFDVQRLLNHIYGIADLQGAAVLAGDINGDGVVDIFDVQRLLNHIYGINPITD